MMMRRTNPITTTQTLMTKLPAPTSPTSAAQSLINNHGRNNLKASGADGADGAVLSPLLLPMTELINMQKQYQQQLQYQTIPSNRQLQPRMKRKRRRSNKELGDRKNIHCYHPNCDRVYASISALATHIRIKHTKSSLLDFGKGKNNLKAHMLDTNSDYSPNPGSGSRSTALKRTKSQTWAIKEDNNSFPKSQLLVPGDVAARSKRQQKQHHRGRRHRSMSESHIPSLQHLLALDYNSCSDIMAPFANEMDLCTFIRTIDDALAENKSNDDLLKSMSLTALNTL